VGSHGVKLGAAPDAPHRGKVLTCSPPVRSASSGGLRLPRTFTHPVTSTPARRGRCTVDQGVRQLLPRPAIRRRRGWPALAAEPGLAPVLAATGVAAPLLATALYERRLYEQRCRDGVGGDIGDWQLMTQAAEGGPYGAAGHDQVPARYEAAWGWRTAQQAARPIGRSLTAGGSGRVRGRHSHLGRTPRE
jgi:hypothetical protein